MAVSYFLFPTFPFLPPPCGEGLCHTYRVFIDLRVLVALETGFGFLGSSVFSACGEFADGVFLFLPQVGGS